MPPEDWGKDLEILLNAAKVSLAEFEDAITGSIVNTYQAIVDVWEIDCQGSWIVYVKTGVTAAGAALFLIVTPSFNEVLENYLQPKPGRLGGRRGRPNDRSRTRPGLGS